MSTETGVFNHEFTGTWKGKVSVKTTSFINGQFISSASAAKTIDVFNPTTGEVITKLHEASLKDLDAAVDAAEKAFNTTWGLNIGGAKRGQLLMKLAEIVEAHTQELAAIESLDNGKPFAFACGEIVYIANYLRYFGGWADKVHGKVIETDESRLNYTRHEPIGVCGQIIPWNFPLVMFAWKIAPALATGNTVVLKPSEFTSLSALRMCELVNEAGIPHGVVNVVLGVGPTIGQAIAEHPKIEKVAFTGSTLVGRAIMKAAAASNLKNVTLELGGKSPTIVFNDADVDQAVNWAHFGLFFNTGQVCSAGTRIFVQSGIYDKFLEKFTARSKAIVTGDPFAPNTFQGPQISQIQVDRVMGYIQSGKQEGATVHLGGSRHGDKGYYIQPTIFTDVKPGMKIVQEEIFGPVGVVAKFETEEDIIHMANDTIYGLGASVFSRDITRALGTAHKIKAGSVWVNMYGGGDPAIPFGGFKQSGMGRENGEYALANYTNVKSVICNLTVPMQ